MEKIAIWVHWVCLVGMSYFTAGTVQGINFQLKAYHGATAAKYAQPWIGWLVPLIFLVLAILVHKTVKSDPEKGRRATLIFTIAVAITNVILVLWMFFSATPWLGRVWLLC